MSIPGSFVNTPDRGPAIFIVREAAPLEGGAIGRNGGWSKEGIGAGDGNRTHDIQLGKLTFYL